MLIKLVVEKTDILFIRHCRQLLLALVVLTLSACAGTSTIKMNSTGITPAPVSKVFIQGRTTFKLQNREYYFDPLVAVIGEVLDEQGIPWAYTDAAKSGASLKGLRKARKKFAASHILLIKRDRARAVITRFGEAKLKAYTISLSLTDIAAQTDVWQGEVENTQIVDHGKNDKARLKSLVEQHFVKAGIISIAGV